MTTRKMVAALLPVLGVLAAACGPGGKADPQEKDCNGVAGGAATVDNCGTCDADPSNDCAQDCAGTWGGTATADHCGTCDADPSNDCVQDCAGTWGGTATVDACGTCDSDPKNDCWLHGSHGTITTPAPVGLVSLDSGTLLMTRCHSDGHNDWSWYFYTGGSFTGPEVTIGNLSATSTCDAGYQGVTGASSLGQLTDVSALTYDVATNGAAMVGTRRQNVCYQGLIVFKQDDQYGVIDFLEGYDNQLLLEYWIGDPGVTDFSDAPPSTG